MRRYQVVLHRTDEGISVSVPGLPGCWSEGDTEAEALENIQDAIREHLAALAEQIQGAEVREVEVWVSTWPKYWVSTIWMRCVPWRRPDFKSFGMAGTS